MSDRTLDQIKLIEEEMHEFLANVPMALNNPFARHQTMLKEISALEKTISRLKRILKYLSELTSVLHLKWMHKAFSSTERHTPTAYESKVEPQSTELSTSSQALSSAAPSSEAAGASSALTSSVLPFRRKRKAKDKKI